MDKIEAKDIFEFYLSDKFDPKLPANERFRHFRVKLPDKSWRKIKEKIYTKEDLVKNIIKLGGVDLYYSTSWWLNPQKISTKGGSGTYIVADNLLLGNDLVFDIDAKGPVTLKSLDLARKSTNNIYEAMKGFKDRYKLSYFAWSGGKGFRLVYQDKQPLPTDSRARLDFVEKNRKVFIDRLVEIMQEKRSLGTFYNIEPFFDKAITTNVMCVIRMLGSVHSSTGYLSVRLPIAIIRKPIRKILDHVPYIGKRRPVIPNGEMTTTVRNVTASSATGNIGKDVSGLASLPPIKYFITNRVLGIRRNFIPFFRYQKSQQYYQKELLALQDRFKLGPIFLFQDEDSIVAISIKAMQKRQLQKILNTSTSVTKHAFKKYNRIFLPFYMKFIKKMSSKYTGHLSKGHQAYVEPSRDIQHGNYCGWGKIEFIRAEFVPRT